MLVAGAYRSAEVDRAHPLTALLAALQREGVLELQPLGALRAEECRTLVETMSGRPAAPAVAEALYRATEGHPLFLAELASHLLAEGHDLSDAVASLQDWQVPAGLRAVIDARLARLSENAGRLLQAAAVLGDGVRFHVLKEVCGIEPLPLLDALDEVLAAGLLQEDGEAYSHSHALVREALLDGLSLPRRQRLHGPAAQAIGTLYAADLTPHLAALALHSRLAGPGVAPQALAYARQAGEAALAVYAWEDAAEQWQAALALLGPADTAERCELLLALGEARQRTGESAAEREAFQLAADLARRLGDRELLARAVLGYAGAWTTFGRSDAAVVTLLEAALAALGDEESALRCWLLARLAMELIYSDTGAHRDTLCAEAAAAARRLGDAATLAYVLVARHHVLAGPAWLEERLAMVTEIVATAEAVGDKQALAGGRD